MWEIVRQYLLDSALVFLGLIAILISAYVSYILSEGAWFQRSGALLVLFSVILEFRQAQAAQVESAKSVSAQGRPLGLKKPLPTARKLMHWYAIGAIVLGTIVWGYGDLFFSR